MRSRRVSFNIYVLKWPAEVMVLTGTVVEFGKKGLN